MTLTVEERFLSKCEPEPMSGCWLWTANTSAGIGYGGFWFDGITRCAHRVAFALFRTEPIGDLHVLHRCDVRSCVNPAHLFLGTPKDNMQDMSAKGRSRKGHPHKYHHRGETNPNARLTPAQVMDIRARYAAGGISQQRLADEYGTRQAVISRIVLRKAWACVA